MTFPVTSGVERKRNPGSTKILKGETRFSPQTRAWLVLTESKPAPDGQGWVHDCETDIMGATVFLTFLDGLFLLSSGGQTRREDIPYCPKCEYKPEGHGSIDPQGNILVQALLA